MTGPLPVRGIEISSAPCSVRKAVILLRRFLSSKAASEVGIARGYVETVAQSLEEIQARGKSNGTGGLKLKTAVSTSKFFNVQQAPPIPEIIMKSQKEKESKQKKKDQAMLEFEALLGHELDDEEIGNQEDGVLGLESKSDLLPSTPRQVDSVGDGRVSQESEKKKKKKKNRTSLGGAAMDVDIDQTQSFRKTEDTEPDTTKSSKKTKKRKSLDVVMPDGLSVSPAKEVKPEARAEVEDMEPADDVRKKRKKKHRVDTSQGATQESEKVNTKHANGTTADRGRNGNDSSMHEQLSVKMKSRKRSSEVSPGNVGDQRHKSKKLRLSA